MAGRLAALRPPHARTQSIIVASWHGAAGGAQVMGWLVDSDEDLKYASPHRNAFTAWISNHPLEMADNPERCAP